MRQTNLAQFEQVFTTTSPLNNGRRLLRLVQSDITPPGAGSEGLGSYVTTPLEDPSEFLARSKHRKFLGSVGLSEMVPDPEELELQEVLDETNILKKLRGAEQGNEADIAFIDANAAFTLFEGVCKDPHIFEPVVLKQDEHGNRTRHGQSLTSINRNAILFRPNRHPNLVRVTLAEALNADRIEAKAEQGTLKDVYVIESSLVPDDVPEELLGSKGDGYFLEPMTLALRLSTGNEGGDVVTQTAFRPGVEQIEGDTFQQRTERRFDLRALAIVYKRLGKKAPKTTLGFLENPLTINKKLMPNGMADFLCWYDQAVDFILGRQVERSPQDYVQEEAQSRRKEATLRSYVTESRDELIASYRGISKDPKQAVQLLYDIVRKNAIKAAVENVNIDPKVLGRAAAKLVVKARASLLRGDHRGAQFYTREVAKVAEFTACGGGGWYYIFGEGADKEDSHNFSLGEERDNLGSRYFNCPHCGEENYRDEENQQREKCQHCKRKVKCE